MNVLILRTDETKPLKQLSEAIAEGAKAAGERPVLAVPGEATAKVSSFDLVFFGFNIFGPIGFKGRVSPEFNKLIKQTNWEGIKIGIYCTYSSKPNKDTIGAVVSELTNRGARIVNSLGIRVKKGFFGEEVTETDLIRARGFGERTTNNVKGTSVARVSEKRRIKKYLKP